MPNPFHRFEHRSHDLAAARAFYDHVLDGLPWGDVFSLAPLPERAKAAGAPPHWLGHVGVEDVALTGQRLEERGAQRLGPPAFRDPFGAIVALCPKGSPSDRIGWHLLITDDEAKAWSTYSSLFGWKALALREVAGARHQSFSWGDSDEPVGSVSNLAGRQGVHPQWQFFFRVPDIAAALERVRRLSGLALEPTVGGTGALLAACDDPQGGAFGLFQAPNTG